MPESSSASKRSSATKLQNKKFPKAFKRSRSGCLACKARHIKCDEGRPKCRNCSSKKLKCQYQMKIQFKEDLISKNKCFGREGVWSKHNNVQNNHNLDNASTSIGTVFFLDMKNFQKLRCINYYLSDFDESLDSHTCYFDHRNYDNDSLATKRFDFESLHQYLSRKYLSKTVRQRTPFNMKIDSNISHALSFYIEYVSPIFNPVKVQNINSLLVHRSTSQNGNSKSSHNNNVRLILHNGLDMNSLIQYGQVYQHVLLFSLSIGSLYLSKFNNLGQQEQKYWYGLSQTLRASGFKYLISSLQATAPSNQVKVDLLLSFLLITLYDLAHNCDNSWSKQFETCKCILNKAVVDPEKFDVVELSLFRYVIEFFAYQESMGRTACKGSNIFNRNIKSSENQSSTEQNAISPQGFSESIDCPSKEEIVLIPWMGCDKRLVGIISDITDLSFERLNLNIDSMDFLIMASNLSSRLEQIALKDFDFDNYLISIDSGFFDSQSTRSSDFDQESLLYVNQLDLDTNRYTIEDFCFLLACEVKRLSATLYIESAIFNRFPSHPENTDLVNKIYKYIRFIVIDNNYRWSSLTWPLYIISAELNLLDSSSEVKKLNILKMLETLELNSLGNISRAKESVIEIWKRRSLGNGEVKMSPAERADQNDWETYIVDFDCNLSLA